MPLQKRPNCYKVFHFCVALTTYFLAEMHLARYQYAVIRIANDETVGAVALKRRLSPLHVVQNVLCGLKSLPLSIPPQQEYEQISLCFE